MTEHDDVIDRRLAEALSQARNSFRVPGQPPVDAMWERIEAAHFAGPQDGLRLDSRHITSSRVARWRTWGALAATLVLGVAIGRFGLAPVDPGAPATIASAPSAGDPAPVIPIDPAMSVHLSQMAALLVALPTQPSNGEATRALATRAAELLSNTRVLLDSESSSSDAVRTLLEDLELVLVQIVRLHGGKAEDLDLINQALEQRDVLPRLHMAVSSTTTAD